MRYLELRAAKLPDFLSCGKLVKKNNFLHPRRRLDSFVLIYVSEGTFYVTQHDTTYRVGKGQFILLHADTLHYGHQATDGLLSYFWIHFRMEKPHVYLETKKDNWKIESRFPELCLIPEYGSLGQLKRIPVLFTQLLDLSMRYNERSHILQYALAVLLLELSWEALERDDHEESIYPYIHNIKSWIRKNYQQTISIAGLAEMFHYNPNYLSHCFKRATGITLSQFIMSVRLEAAQHYLTATNCLMKEIANYCGFSDEKYFFRVFRAAINMTPTEFRSAFYQNNEITG